MGSKEARGPWTRSSSPLVEGAEVAGAHEGGRNGGRIEDEACWVAFRLRGDELDRGEDGGRGVDRLFVARDDLSGADAERDGVQDAGFGAFGDADDERDGAVCRFLQQEFDRLLSCFEQQILLEEVAAGRAGDAEFGEDDGGDAVRRVHFERGEDFMGVPHGVGEAEPRAGDVGRGPDGLDLPRRGSFHCFHCFHGFLRSGLF